MTSAETKVAHIWMPDARSLCDRAARPRPAKLVPTLDEFAAENAAEDAAPACGICLLLASYLRTDAAVLLEERSAIYPPTASEAWASLVGTRWNLRFDAAEFSTTKNLDKTVHFGAVNLQVDPAKARKRIAEQKAERAKTEDALRRYWEHHSTEGKTGE